MKSFTLLCLIALAAVAAAEETVREIISHSIFPPKNINFFLTPLKQPQEIFDRVKAQYQDSLDDVDSECQEDPELAAEDKGYIRDVKEVSID